MTQVETIALERHATQVISIVVGLGPLSGVEEKLLQHAYPMASAGSIAEQAELLIEPIPLKVECTQCGQQSKAVANKMICGFCGDWRTSVVSGDELLLMSVELETDSVTH